MKAQLEQQGLGPVEMKLGKSGQFDVVRDGTMLYSRYQTGRFPSTADLASV